MPFGLCNTPSTFQAAMNHIFSPYLHQFVVVFFDDILIYSPTLNEHYQHLLEVFRCLANHRYYLKASKCVFAQESVAYLGHIVSKGGIEADPSKIEAMENWPMPQNIKQLHGFLRLTRYYRRFVQHYAAIATPLTDLLGTNAFNWSPQADVAFQNLKRAMASTPVLYLPDFSLEFVVETDASNIGVGAVLMQQERPIAFYSRKFSPRMQSASTYTKELHAITEAVHKWRQYLLGRFFIARTDHKSIRELLQQTIQTPEQQRYVQKLLGFHFRIDYRMGKSNLAADPLSRLAEESNLKPEEQHEYIALTSISTPISELLSIHRQENSTCSDLISLYEKFKNGKLDVGPGKS